MLKVTEGARGVHVSGGGSGDGSANDHGREGIGELFSRALTEGKAFASAEVNVVKTTALAKVDEAKMGVVYLVAGGLLAYAGLIAFLVEVGEWFSDSLEFGPLLGGLATLALVGLISFILVKMGTSHLSKMGKAGAENGK